MARPHSSRIRPSALVALIYVDGAEEKGYEHLPPLDESVAAYLYAFPPVALLPQVLRRVREQRHKPPSSGTNLGCRS